MRRKISQFILWLERQRNYFIAFLCSLILIGGTIYSALERPQLQFVDEREYVALARSIIQEHSYSIDSHIPTAYRPPGYPLLLSGLIALGLDVTAMRLLNFIFLAGSVLLTYKLVKELHTVLAGVIAAGLVACYPVLFYSAGTLVPQTTGAFILLLALTLTVRTDAKAPLRYLAAGFLWGFQILAIPSFLFTIVLFFVWPLWQARSLRALKLSFLFVFGIAIVVTPWTIRNYNVFHKLVLVSTNSGVNLLLGNSEHTTVNGGASVDISQYWDIPDSFNEAQKDSHYAARAIEYISHNKIRSLKMYFSKFLNYFSYGNDLNTREKSARLQDYVMIATYGPLIIIFLLRLLSSRIFPPTREEMFLILMFIGSGFFLAIYFTRIRFRLPYDYLIIAIVAIYLANLADKWLDIKGREQSKG